MISKGKKRSVSTSVARKKRNTLIIAGVISIAVVVVFIGLTMTGGESGGGKGWNYLSTPAALPAGLKMINLEIGGMF